jgi:DNA processing protein
MDFPILKMSCEAYSPLLKEIPDAPQEVYMRGEKAPQGTKCLAVVGSRNYSNYGKQAVEYLIGGLRECPVSIISGLALGIDALAHENALNAGLFTVAVPGSGIDDSVLYPRRNRGLARRILERGGGLLSEYEPESKATTWSFPRRNRIMAGLAHAVLLIEAGEKSGTLITARLTAEYNRELLVVPGSIFSDQSKGVHQFLKLGATPITSPADILEVLGIEREAKETNANTNLKEEERLVLEILSEPRDQDSIIRLLPIPPQETLILLMQMELSGHVKEQNGIFYKI